MKTKITNKFNPKVSIIIPVYNGSNYLKEAIDSALAQTYKNIEIIVVNDGSNDNGGTEKIAKGYGKKILYFNKQNGGTSTALNSGIKKMSGDYFSWLSHDDQYYPRKIERQVEELGKLENKNTIMMSDLDGIDENYKKIYQTNYIARLKEYPPRNNSFLFPIIYNQTHGCTLLISKTCFDKVGLFDEEMKVAQDFEFFYRAFSKFPHKLIPEVLVTARESPNRQGHRSKAKGNEEYSNLYIKMIENLTDQEIKQLAPSKIKFYIDMKDFFWCANYTIGFDYIIKKLTQNLQISSYDLVGNKFNGFDLHLDLRDKGLDSNFMCLYKESKDENTFQFNFNSKDATKELIKNPLFYKSQLIHLHLVHNILDLNYLPLITDLKPTVITLHDPFFLSGHCVHHFDCDKWKTHCKDCPYLDKLFPLESDYSALNFEIKKRAFLNSNLTVIVASKWMERKVKQSPMWKNKKIIVLPFGIDQNLFSPKNVEVIKQKLQIPLENKVIMFRSDKNLYKGMDIVIKALKEINNKNKVTLISVGEKGTVSKFKQEFQVLEYDWIKDDSLLSDLYSVSDIFLMPSNQETFGMMAIEAMSCGTFVLSIKSPGSALEEIINSPKAGISVYEKEFSATLNHFLTSNKELGQQKALCLEFARNNYSKEKYINRMVNIYKSTIENTKISESSKLIIEQLDKYNVNSNVIEYSSSNPSVVTNKTLLRKLYSNIPISIRRKNKKLFFILADVFKSLVPSKIKNYVKKRINR